MNYTHLLAAIETDDDGQRVLERAHALAQGFNARLTVIHVIDFLPVEMAESMLAVPVDFSEERARSARDRLLPWIQNLAIPSEQLQIVTGDIAREIVRVGTEQGVDLIVVGHHRHRGLSALFTHTEEGVLSRADCDVLAVALEKVPA